MKYALWDVCRNLAVGLDNRCHVELATGSMSKEQMDKVEGVCNDLIRQGLPMTPRWCAPDSAEMEMVGLVGGFGIV